MKKLRVLEQPCCAPGAPPLPKRSAEAIAERFKALSDPARVSIVNRIAGQGEVCTCQLTAPLGLSQPTVSHHLRVLKEAGLIKQCGPGPRSGYCINREALVWLKQAVVAL